MAKRKQKNFGNRAWLNTSKTLTASVSWEYNSFGMNDGASAELVIKDCTRSISLEFYHDNAKTKKAALHKIDILIREINKLREAIEDE